MRFIPFENFSNPISETRRTSKNKPLQLYHISNAEVAASKRTTSTRNYTKQFNSVASIAYFEAMA